MLSKVRMRIPGMRSAETARQVSDALIQVQGVADVGLNADIHLVEVRFDPEKTSQQDLMRALDGAGFSAEPHRHE